MFFLKLLQTYFFSFKANLEPLTPDLDQHFKVFNAFFRFNFSITYAKICLILVEKGEKYKIIETHK